MHRIHQWPPFAAATILLGMFMVGIGGCSNSPASNASEVSLEIPTTPACALDDDCAHLTTNCAKGVCDGDTGECTVILRPLGSACDVELDCALGRCISGVCSPEIVLNCDDNKPCTNDICDMDKGCLHTPKISACDDNNPCTKDDMCDNGDCTSGTYVCDECTDDSDCDQYNDEDACNGRLVCDTTINECHVETDSVAFCTSANPCMSAICNATSGQCEEHPRPNGSTCSDSDLCTLEDRCFDGECTGAALTCPPTNNACLASNCGPKTACTLDPRDGQPCTDGNQCTVDDLCQQDLCGGTTVDTCVCNQDSDCALYDDEDLCNGIVRCMDGQCLVDPATIPHCVPPGKPCVSVQCTPETGACETGLTEGPCSDGDLCTTNDLCSEGNCQGEPLACDDNDECTQDSCTAGTGCLYESIEGCGGPCETGMTEVCNGCGLRACTDNTWGLCEGGIDCDGKGCGDDGCGGSCGTCSESQECVDGICTGTDPCPGECVLGETESKDCGKCGVQVRSCTDACSWGAWSECSEEGACAPEDTQSQGCGDCNVQTRTCSDQCSWGEWGQCSGQGACTPGDTQTQDCGNCGTELRACNNECSWGGWSGCDGQGECSSGDTQSQGCGNCGTQTRSCNSGCNWDGWSGCDGQGECSSGDTQSQGCGNCGTQTRSCNSGCNWDGWSGCDGQGECSSGDTQSQGCGKCGTQTRSCNNGCNWDGWSGCTGEKACDAGKTITQGCGACGSGEQDKSCDNNCNWGSWSGCKKTKNKTIQEACGNCGTKTKTCQNNAEWNSWSKCEGQGCQPGTIGDCDQPPCDGTKKCKNNCTWDTCIMKPNCCGDGQCTSGEDCSSCPQDCACSKKGTVCANGECVCGPGSDYKLVGSECLPSCGAYANDNGWGQHSCCTGVCPAATGGVGPGNVYDCNYCCKDGPVQAICPEWQ